MKLLIINDEILSAESMKSDINWSNYGIKEADAVYNAKEAKEYISKNKVDILLCDIEMPGESGIDLLRWVREKKLDIEFIIITCHAKFKYAKEAISLGCQDYILIPTKDEEIGEIVQKAVNRIKKEKEEYQLKKYGKQWINEKKKSVEEYEENDEKTKLKGKELVREVEKYINKNLSESHLSVNEIANHFYIHPVYLNRIFKKDKNISISQYIISERMQLAANIIKESDASAKNIATQVGYDNYPHFVVMFKKYFGLSPTQYKEKN